ncbi:MAG: AlpA family transcriptional regulator [Rhodospirillaceae bacterium]|jgi:prophage regulatory protein|nr:AlpA family transcriptional regulator [Rhodospirillaceae bacterium]
MPNSKILNLREVIDLTSLSESTIRRWVETEQFPKPLRLGGRRIGWNSTDIETWFLKDADRGAQL